MNELGNLHAGSVHRGQLDMPYRVIYFVRRGLATLTEFRRGLTAVRKSREFKDYENRISAKDAENIAEADRFLQRHWDELKALRNEFAGHIQQSGVKFAVGSFTEEVGSVTWNTSPKPWVVGLECDFAGYVVAGAILSKIQRGGDLRAELRMTNEILGAGFLHAQMAMVALVHAFLWDRFGK
jgi:hypothetical protein